MRTIKRSIVWLICLVMLLGMLPTISFAEDTEEGLVLHYDFESLQNGTIVEDISGNGKAAEVMPRASGVEIREVEIYGSPKTAIVIAGGSPSTGHNYVELPVGVLNDLESVTISCWVYVNQTVSYGRIWDFGSNTTSYMYLLDAGANSGHEGYTAAMTNSGWSNEIGPVKGSNLATRTWKLTTVTFDGDTRTLSLYEDGELIDSATTSSNLSILEGSTQNWIGYGQFKDDLFNGMIADFRIYNYAMSDAEVAQLFDIPDDDRVQRDYNALSLGNTTNLEQNLTLPVTGSAGSSIEWTSSDEGVITAQGVITRPAPGEPNGAATLTARIFYGEAEMEKTFDVTVLAQPTNEDRVSIDAAAINLGSLDGVTSNLTLPVKGAKGSDITWTSSDPAHLSDTGTVTRPVGAPVTVTLTALVSYEDASTTREFRVTILPVYEKLDAVKAEPVAVITEVGIAPALPAVVLTTFEDGSKRMVKVTWPTNLSGSNYAEVGEQTVTGALVDFDVSVTATVTVVEEVAPADAAASLLALSSVSLDGDDSIYAQNYGRAKEYLKVMDADRMLYNFRKTFGQDTKGASALSGWDEPTGLLRGHSTGHFMSALAEAYASTGDVEYKEKLDYMIDAMRELQLLSQGKASEFATACTPSDAAQSKWSTDPSTWGEGFISAYSPDQFALLEQYTPYATIWAPYYTMHKLLAGFLDSYVYAGNETGLQIATDLGLWVYDRLSACTPEQRTRMWSMYIAGEYGGMNEVLARLYEITGDERLLTASRMFDNTTFFDGLAEGRDTIQNRHANQHIPQIVGAIHEYAATGDPYYFNVAYNFWEMATARYAYSIGGVGTGESFKAPYAQGVNINGNSSRGENCETCAAYNMLKLTRDLYIYDPDNAAYMDYYERTVLNQIAASQSHNSTASMHNGCTYMLPIDPGQRRSYDSDYGGFTCCNGTGMENHVIYQIAAYAKTDDTIYVNLYMPSTAQWTEKNVTVKQETRFPSEDVKLTVTGSGSFKMKLRVPYWATAGYEVKVNGETVCTAPTPSSYVELDREWADGDVVDIHMPYTLYLDKTPDRVNGSLVASLMYGPMVMVARDTNSRYTAMNWYTLNLNDTNLDAAVSIEEPAGTGSVPHLVAEGLDFYPMYDAYNYRYHAYVKLMDAQSVLNPEYLQAAVDKVTGDDAPVEDNFSAVDWQTFQDALGAAQALLEKVPAVSQVDLYDAQVALEEAASKADEPVLDKTALEAAINTAEAVDTAAYSDETVAALEAALEAAKSVLASDEADQAAVDAAAEALNNAIKALEKKPVEGGMADIDFTDPADKVKYEISGQTESNVEEGIGLALVTSQGGIEPAKRDIAEQDIDVIRVPVAGDWTATLEVEFDVNGAANGYYQFFGFVASEGGDNQNMVGIRGGDGAMQDFIRKDGAVSEELNTSTPGFDTTGKTYYLRIEKADDAYTCYRSEDGEEFTEMFSFDATGIEADEILIDAYTGMTAGYKFTLKSLTFEGGEATPVDKSKLDEAIETAEAINTDSYTEESVAALAAAIEAAKAVQADTDATQKAVNDAAKAVNDAVKALEQKPAPVDKSALNKAIEDAEAVDTELYTDESVAALDAAIEAAKAVQADPDATQAAVDAAATTVDDAVKALEKKPDVPPVIDKTELDKAINAAGLCDENDYTSESYAPLAQALEAAKAVQAKENATQEEVNDAAAAVNEAIAGLEKKPDTLDKAALIAAISEAEELDPEEYTEESAKALTDGIAAAKDALANAADQDAIDAAVAALDEVVKGLEKKPIVPPVDKTALEEAIAAAEDLDPADYTEESAKALADGIVAAKEALANAADQDAIDDAVAALKDVVDNLEKKPDEPPFRFDDVKDEGKFYFEPVYWAFNSSPQITNGVDATHFGPDNPCTRGHVVTFLWRAAGCPEPEDAQTSFTDLKPGAFYEKAVAWAVETGITNGVSPTAFAPNDTCTRGQIVTFLWRFRGKQEPKSTDTPFTDLKPGAFYEKAVAWAVELGVTKGMTKSTFVPDGTCTRGQVVTFLYRAIEE